MKAAWVNLLMKDVIGAIILICSSLWMDGWMDGLHRRRIDLQCCVRFFTAIEREAKY